MIGAFQLGVVAAAIDTAVVQSGVAFVSSNTGPFLVASSSSLATPVGVLLNDAVLCVVMHRSVVVPPSGWTLLATKDVAGSVSPDHAVSVYRMNTPSSGTFTWQQANVDRFKLVYVLLRSDSGVVSHLGSASSNKTTSENDYHELPTVIAAHAGELHLQCSTCVYAYGQDTLATEYIAPAGSTSISGEPVVNNRLGVAFVKPGLGGQSGGHFTHVRADGATIGNHDGAELVLAFSP